MAALAGYALIYVAAAFLGRPGVGTLGVLVNLTLLGQIVAAYGLNVHLARVVAQRPNEGAQALGRGLLISVPSGILVCLTTLALTFSGFLPPSSMSSVRLATLAILPGALAIVCEGFLTGRERISLVALANIAEGIVRLAVGLGLMVLGWGTMALATALIIARSAALGVDLWLIRRHFGTVPQFRNLTGMREDLAAALSFSGIFLLTAVFTRADVLILAPLAGEAQTGLFVAGFRPVEVATIVPLSLLVSLYPVLSRQIASEKGIRPAQRSFERALVIVLGIMLGGAAFLAIDSDLIIRVLYPAGFHEAAQVLSISALSLIPFTVDTASIALMMAKGQARRALVPLAVGVGSLIALNLVLDPQQGAEGAAIARVVATTIIAVLNVRIILQGLGVRWILGRLLGIAAGLVPLVIVLWIGRDFAPVSIPLAGALYMTVLLLAGVVSRRDLLVLCRGLSVRKA